MKTHHSWADFAELGSSVTPVTVFLKHEGLVGKSASKDIYLISIESTVVILHFLWEAEIN